MSIYDVITIKVVDTFSGGGGFHVTEAVIIFFSSR